MKVGLKSYKLDRPVSIINSYSLVGPVETRGKLREFFDMSMEDDEWDCKSHEMAEIKMQKFVAEQLIKNSGLKKEDISAYLGGDLINQITATSFAVRDIDVPFLGLYNACATFGESLIIGSLLCQLDLEKVICITSSHFATTERQYRYPLELGTQPTPESQWTVTACGGVILSKKCKIDCPKVKSLTIGNVVDMGVTDANNMGMAMAPAAADTIYNHFKELNLKEDYYDLVITGDLGKLGRDTVDYLLKDKGLDLSKSINDCGALIYDEKQKKCQGGSGAGCSSAVFASYIYKNMINKNFKKVLLVPTGALLSKDSPLQKETIPAIAHAVAIEVN